ncbi:hypothetical protein BRD56_03280 [Thermoplasmatales archaeon SW_10_69_26]|nr:MAG: hypothetical protein BRD56_03280 [Thermoplasmatales archaeon SW_10_69_26]
MNAIASEAPTVDAHTDAHVALQPLPSIVIEGDAAFEGPTVMNGVRGGNGTAEDPYRITNWTIASNGDAGIHLQDTSAHVIIEDVFVPGTPPATYGIRLTGAEVHGNSFPGTAPKPTVFAEDANASRNWWGDASGPLIEDDPSSGEGHPLNIVSTNVTFAPNLTSEPETGPSAVNCGGNEGPIGLQARPDLTAGARFGLDGGASPGEPAGTVSLTARAQAGAGVPKQTPPPLSWG